MEEVAILKKFVESHGWVVGNDLASTVGNGFSAYWGDTRLWVIVDDEGYLSVRRMPLRHLGPDLFKECLGDPGCLEKLGASLSGLWHGGWDGG